MNSQKNNMENLIKALQIFLKYGNPNYPSHCEHDVFSININPELVSNKDKEELEELGFFVNDEEECFESFRYGSC